MKNSDKKKGERKLLPEEQSVDENLIKNNSFKK